MIIKTSAKRQHFENLHYGDFVASRTHGSLLIYCIIIVVVVFVVVAVAVKQRDTTKDSNSIAKY